MSNLSAFLNPIPAEQKEIVVSNRFVGENGEPVPFKIRPLTQEENEALVRAATIKRKGPNGYTQEFDRQRYSRSVVVSATVYPDFRSTELCEGYGVLDPLLVPGRMLYAGEYQKLSDAIAELSGISDDAEGEAKN